MVESGNASIIHRSILKCDEIQLRITSTYEAVHANLRFDKFSKYLLIDFSLKSWHISAGWWAAVKLSFWFVSPLLLALDPTTFFQQKILASRSNFSVIEFELSLKKRPRINNARVRVFSKFLTQYFQTPRNRNRQIFLRLLSEWRHQRIKIDAVVFKRLWYHVQF